MLANRGPASVLPPQQPKIYTQPQLFACLVLKTFFKTDYRGIEQMLLDLPDLVQVLGLKAVPHFTALQKASERVLARQQDADALVFDCDTHLILAAFGTTGPRPDTDRFIPLLEAALAAR